MPRKKNLRERTARIVFLSDTKAGRTFDMIVLWLIILSVLFVSLDSVESYSPETHRFFQTAEWIFTICFTIEYFLRIYSARDRWHYIFSFYGILDLLAIIPSYIGLFFIGTQHLLIVRILRLLRIFRIFQMGHFVREGAIVGSALRASRVKITVFVVFVIIASVFLGAMMYMVEADYNPKLASIPNGIYWAIVTLTTIGYGDVVPITGAGKFLASVVMILGYGVIAVPTGIVTAEISSRVITRGNRLKVKCTNCGDDDHLLESAF